MSKLERGDILRLSGLGVAVLLEGGAVVSAVLRSAALPLGVFYPNFISVAVFVLPTIVGLLARRLEAALLLAVLPFYALALVYVTIYSPIWNVDLFQLGVLASRVGGSSVLLAALGAVGWLVQRLLRGKGIAA